MQLQKYKVSENIITYGDQGTHYYILSKGTVKVIVYHPGTDPKDSELTHILNILKNI